MSIANAWLGAFALLAAAGAPAVADTSSLESRYRLATEIVEHHSDMSWLDRTDAGRHALDRAWRLIAEWTAAYLNEHAGATPGRLKNAAPNDAQTTLDAIVLAPGTWLVSAGVDGFGTVFIVDRADGTFRPVWSIRSRQARAAFPLLTGWTTRAAAEDCREDDMQRGECGPLDGSAARLPDDASGDARFYVQATYAQAAETTVGGQLSVWTWTGRTAQPLFVRRYAYNFEDMRTVFEDGLLTIRATDYYRMFFSCGTCIGRQMDWTIRIGPDRIDDLGMTPVVPELDAVDELFFRVWHHLPADATPNVLTAAAAVLKDQEDSAVFDPGSVSLGMMADTSVRHRARRTLVCFSTDDVAPMLFTVEDRDGKPFFSDVRKPASGQEQTCLHDKP